MSHSPMSLDGLLHKVSYIFYGLENGGFNSRQTQDIFFYSTASRTAVGATQAPIQWIPEAPNARGKIAGARNWQLTSI
jgi:hypothetical protein